MAPGDVPGRHPHPSPAAIACDYGAAELLLRHLYPGAAAAAGATAGRIVGFDQTEFLDGEPRMSLNAVGYLYVPAACEKARRRRSRAGYTSLAPSTACR